MKNPIFRGVGSRKTNIKGEGFPKRGAWTVCRFRGWGGAWQERGGGAFEGGIDNLNAHYGTQR